MVILSVLSVFCFVLGSAVIPSDAVPARQVDFTNRFPIMGVPNQYRPPAPFGFRKAGARGLIGNDISWLAMLPVTIMEWFINVPIFLLQSVAQVTNNCLRYFMSAEDWTPIGGNSVGFIFNSILWVITFPLRILWFFITLPFNIFSFAVDVIDTILHVVFFPVRMIFWVISIPLRIIWFFITLPFKVLGWFVTGVLNFISALFGFGSPSNRSVYQNNPGQNMEAAISIGTNTATSRIPPSFARGAVLLASTCFKWPQFLPASSQQLAVLNKFLKGDVFGPIGRAVEEVINDIYQLIESFFNWLSGKGGHTVVFGNLSNTLNHMMNTSRLLKQLL